MTPHSINKNHTSSHLNSQPTGKEIEVIAALKALPPSLWVLLTNQHSKLLNLVLPKGGEGEEESRGFDSILTAAIEFNEGFCTQTTYDVSIENLHRSFETSDPDRNDLVDMFELTECLERTQDFEFSSFPTEFVRMMGVTQGMQLTDAEIAEYQADSSKMRGWQVAFPVFRSLVQLLKLHLLLNPVVVRMAFKELRFERLLHLSAGVRYLNRMEKVEKKERGSPSQR